MAEKTSPRRPVYDAILTDMLQAFEVIYNDFNVSLERWLNDILNHPIPEDWRDEVARFVDETERNGLEILPDLVRGLEAIIESCIAGTDEFAELGPAPRAPANGVASRAKSTMVAAEADAQTVETQDQAAPVGHPKAPAGHQNFSVGAQQFFDEKVASAKGHLNVLKQLLNVAGERIDAAKPGEEVDVDYEAAMVDKHLFLYNEDLLVAGDVWLRFNLSSDGIARMTELINPMSLGLPMFASPAQAERARQQRSEISHRLNQQNASMDAWLTGIQATGIAATAAGVIAGAGIVIVAAKKGGTRAVIKTVAAGAAVIGADRAADAGLRAPARANRQ